MGKFNNFTQIGIILVSLLQTCHPNNDTGTNLYHPKVIINNTDERISFSEHILDFRIIPIEYSSEKIIGRIDKVVQDKDEFLILDYKDQSIKRITQEGRIISSFNHSGRAAGEYIKLSDFFVHPVSSEIVALDGLGKKIIHYNREGQFLREYKINFWGSRLAYLSDNKFVVFSHRTAASGEPPFFLVNIISDKGEILKSYLPYYAPWTSWIASRVELQENNGSILISCYFDYNLYMIDENMDMDTIALFDFGAYSIDTSNLAHLTRQEKIARLKNRGGSYGLDRLFVFDSICLLLANTVDNEYWSCGYFDQSFILHKRMKERYLDFFRGWPVIEPMGKIGDRIVTWIEPVYLLEFWNQHPELKTEAQLNPEYKKIIDGMTDEGNPILFFYRLKAK